MNGWSWKRTVNNENLEKNIAFGAGVLNKTRYMENEYKFLAFCISSRGIIIFKWLFL